MSRQLLGAFIAILFVNSVQAAILVSKDGRSANQSVVKTAGTAMDLREQRRVGVDFSYAGEHGVLGASLEINLQPKWSVLSGFGLGDRYQSYSIKVRHYFGGQRVVPFADFGYARWVTRQKTASTFSSTSPGFLGTKFLNADEKDQGEFAVNLLYPAIGIQYMQLGGEYAGVGVHAKILMLMDVDDFVAAPTGEVGVSFYF